MAITRIAFWTWIWSTRHCRLGQKVACDFNTGKTQIVLFGAIDVKKDESVLEKKKWSAKMLGLTFSSKLD